MDLEEFISRREPWANSPCLYVILQDGGIKLANGSFVQNNKYRAGASGTHLYQGADLPYRSEDAINRGLNSRCNMYLNYFRPFSGKIFAALRIKQALVAEVDRDRVATDSTGVTYNVDRGSRTLVLAREREFHQILDERGLRYMKDKRNELFEPRSNVNELIAALRQVRGEELYLMTKDAVSQDPNYRGGSRKERITITETQPRQQPQRESRAPSLTITLSRSALEQLRSGNPTSFERLLNLVRSFDEEKKNTTVVRGLPRADVEEIREKTPRGEAIVQGLQQLFTPRRSPRLAELADDVTETTADLGPPPPLRRSARLARK
jgi:hypothetical protein